MPHPIYGWMSWVQILNPSESKLTDLFGLIAESHINAVNKFNKKTVNKSNQSDAQKTPGTI